MNMGGEIIEERREGKKFWKVDWTILLNYNQLSSYPVNRIYRRINI